MIYLVRHQAAGVLHDYPFASSPSAEQLAPILSLMRVLYGERNQDGSEYWVKIVEVKLIDDEIPVVMLPSSSPASAPQIGKFTVSGVGFVA